MTVQRAVNWLESVLIAAATEPFLADSPAVVVAFEVAGKRHCVAIPRGSLVDLDSPVACEVSCSKEVMNSLILGELSLQRAYVMGAAALSGDPEVLMRLAVLFDTASRISRI